MFTLVDLTKTAVVVVVLGAVGGSGVADESDLLIFSKRKAKRPENGLCCVFHSVFHKPFF